MYRLIQLTDAYDGQPKGVRVDMITGLDRVQVDPLPTELEQQLDRELETVCPPPDPLEDPAAPDCDPEGDDAQDEEDYPCPAVDHTVVHLADDTRDRVLETVEEIIALVDRALEWTAHRFYDFEQSDSWKRGSQDDCD